MKFRAEHTFKGTTLAEYEKLYFDEAFNIALCKAVNLDRSLVNREEKDDRISRVLKIGPDREVPAPVAKILGANKIEYTEHLEYRIGSNEGTWFTESSIMTDKVDSRGRFGFQEVPGGVRRWVDGEIKVKLFAVGKVVEKFIVADVEKSYDNAAAFTQKWIDDGKTA